MLPYPRCLTVALDYVDIIFVACFLNLNRFTFYRNSFLTEYAHIFEKALIDVHYYNKCQWS